VTPRVPAFDCYELHAPVGVEAPQVVEAKAAGIETNQRGRGRNGPSSIASSMRSRPSPSVRRQKRMDVDMGATPTSLRQAAGVAALGTDGQSCISSQYVRIRGYGAYLAFDRSTGTSGRESARGTESGAALSARRDAAMPGT
jgi:hypothetical protein